jgi:hypothetical protein
MFHIKEPLFDKTDNGWLFKTILNYKNKAKY